MRYCGRDFTEDELKWINEKVAKEPKLRRTTLSKQFCVQFNWRKPDGGLKDMSCRVAMLRMEKDGHISLPPSILKKPRKKRKIEKSLFTLRQPLHILKAGELKLTFEIVSKRTSLLWGEYIELYHYLGYTPFCGAQLRYFVKSGNDILALLGFSAAAWKVAPRDNFIGWNDASREKNLHLIVNNARFLILPWIKSKNLASRILSMSGKRLPDDWENQYNYRPLLLETFVEKDRFTGSCYKAANWIYVGDTKGRGKKDRYNKYSLPIKSIHLYPLSKSFKEILVS